MSQDDRAGLDDAPDDERFAARAARRLFDPLPVMAAVVLSILGLAALTTFAIVQLRQRADEGRTAEIRLQALATTLERINAAEWKAIAQRSPSPELNRIPSRIADEAAQMLSGFAGDAEAGSLPTLFSRYQRALDLEMQTLAGGDEAGARRIDDEQVDPAFERLHAEIQRASERISGRADALNRRTDLYFAAVVAAAALIASLMFLQLHRAHSHLIELQRAERLLRASEERYRNLFEDSVDPIFVTDRAGRIADLNHAAVALLDRARSELVGAPFSGLRFRQGRDGDEPAATTSLLDGGEQDVRLERAGGTWAECRLSASVRRNDEGVSIGHQVIVRDVTARNLLERQLEQAQRMEVVGRLAGGVAHDFNNLLTVIFGYLDELDSALPEAHSGRPALQEVQKASTKAAFLTQQLLAYSRKQIVSLEVVDLNQLLAANLELLQRVVGERVQIRLVPAPEPLPVKVDPRKFEQVLLNLVLNARDAMPAGGTLTVETADVVVGENGTHPHRAMAPGRYVMLAVNDSGIGMSADVQARVFDPFFTTKEVGKGTGLGLATVYGIVKQCGGEIVVESALGSGTSFRIYLPPSPEPLAPPAAGRLATGTGRGRETILVVEDEPALLALVKQGLEQRGYQVHAARSGEEALGIRRDGALTVDLLVTDVVMPGMTGPALAERLRAECAGMKVLFMTGHTEDTIVHHGVLESGVALQQKPFTPAELCARVREVLDRAGSPSGRTAGA